MVISSVSLKVISATLTSRWLGNLYEKLPSFNVVVF